MIDWRKNPKEFGKLFGISGVEFGVLDIPKQIPDSEYLILEKLIMSSLEYDMIGVEAGTWTGNSACIFGEIIQKLNGKLYCVDWFKGTSDLSLGDITSYVDVYKIFLNNIKTQKLEDTILPMKMSSKEGSLLFKDESLDFVFLDANHKYEYIKEDIELWYPKLKKGGIFSGHDCDWDLKTNPFDINKYIKFPPYYDYHYILEIDASIHSGVVKAVYEKFPNVNMERGIWWIKKE